VETNPGSHPGLIQFNSSCPNFTNLATLYELYHKRALLTFTIDSNWHFYEVAKCSDANFEHQKSSINRLKVFYKCKIMVNCFRRIGPVKFFTRISCFNSITGSNNLINSRVALVR